MRLRDLHLICLMPAALCSCATIEGYPRDPENASATLSTFTTSFDGSDERQYYAMDPTDPGRLKLRNTIIAKRLHGYDIAYASFERQLLGTGNALSTGSDLVGLALGGLTATVGGAGTKAALGAASAGILGANAAVNKDLFYQKTIPALVSQMDANRAKGLLVIFEGMKLPDPAYPLSSALSDLNLYRDAGTLPSAITSITQTASLAKTDAEQKTATFVVGPGAAAQLSMIQSVTSQLRPLTDTQLLKVMAAMDAYLPAGSAALHQLVGQIDAGGTRDSDASIARRILMAWANSEPPTPASVAQWNDAISAATK